MALYFMLAGAALYGVKIFNLSRGERKDRESGSVHDCGAGYAA